MSTGVDVATASSTSVSLDDFMTGLIAGLAAEGIKAVSIRGTDFYAAVEAAFQEFESISETMGLRLKFWITRNPVYGDSADVREGITRAVQRDLISLDNPTYQNMRLRVGQGDSSSYLDKLPGGAEVYHQVARVFLDQYRSSPV